MMTAPEIENPGVLPPQLTPETIKEPHISYPYNPIMADVLFKTTFLENWGSGAGCIMEACRKQNVPIPTWKAQGLRILGNLLAEMKAEGKIKCQKQHWFWLSV